LNKDYNDWKKVLEFSREGGGKQGRVETLLSKKEGIYFTLAFALGRGWGGGKTR